MSAKRTKGAGATKAGGKKAAAAKGGAAKGEHVKAAGAKGRGVAAPKAARAAKANPKAVAAPRGGKLGALDAAAKVLADAGAPMTCQEMVDAMAAAGLWTSPGGKTPAATVYSAILREVRAKGEASRFRKTDRGRFAATGVADATRDTAAEDAAPAAGGKKAARRKAKAASGATGGDDGIVRDAEGRPVDGTPGPKAVSDLFKF